MRHEVKLTSQAIVQIEEIAELDFIPSRCLSYRGYGCGSGKQDTSANIVSEISDIIKTCYIQKDTGTEELSGDMFFRGLYEYLSLKISDRRQKAEQEGAKLNDRYIYK